MKNAVLSLAVVLCSMLGVTDVLADDQCQFQGNTPANSATINQCAEFFKTMLVGKGKLDASWKVVAIDSTELVKGPKGQEWDVVYRNPADPDASKRVLHMIFALSGNVVAVTFAKD